MFPSKMQALVEQLRILPGVGPKTAQRMAINLLSRQRDGAVALAHALADATTHVHLCQQCYGFSETALCGICTSPRRDGELLCVVESPADIFAIEASGLYKGLYFVLGGRLSPIDGIGPDTLHLDALKVLVQRKHIKEIILATSATMEGSATQFYIQQMMQGLDVRMSRLAQGMPSGGELEHIDSNTLSQALAQRIMV